MLITIFGESCTGKSTAAEILKEKLGAKVYTGKDYLRLEKSEAAAKLAFQKLLSDAVSGENVIYVIAEKEHLALVPSGAVRVLATAHIDTIKQRFAKRMNGNLPPPVAAMLENKHGCFDNEPHDFQMISGETDMEELCAEIAERGSF